MLKFKTFVHAPARLADLPYLIGLHTGSYRCACKYGYSGDGDICSGEPVDVTYAEESFQRLSVIPVTFSKRAFKNSKSFLYMSCDK